jgi:hypothetical protein
MSQSGPPDPVSELRALHNAVAVDEALAREVASQHGLDLWSPCTTALGEDATLEEILTANGVTPVPLPRFDTDPIQIALRDIALNRLQDIDDTVFAEWRGLDVPMMFLAGAAGAGLSWFLRDTFANWHDKDWGRHPWSAGGHGGEIVDHVPGSTGGGGFGHRWRFGHDLGNPFEVPWEKYLPDIPKDGVVPIFMRKLFFWMRHLLQDTFSKEGLPLPGHSLFRHWIEPLAKTRAGRETLQFLATIKARDLVGAGATNVIMGAYLWGTEGDLARVTVKANYRAFSLMAGANLVTILCGLLVPPPATSLNWPAVPPLLYYGGRLVWLWHSIDKALAARGETLRANAATLAARGADLAGNEAAIVALAASGHANAACIASLEAQAVRSRPVLTSDEPCFSDWIVGWEAAGSEEQQLAQVTSACAQLFPGRS